MNKNHHTISSLIISLAILSCRFSQSLILPTSTPSPTAIPAPTETPGSIQIAFPTAGGLSPRWMILGQPGYDIEILGETWNYTDDRWGETYGCIDYTRENAPYVFFEQCFALVQENLTFESQQDMFLNDGFETLVPNNTFGDVGQISLSAKRLEDNSEKFIKFFEIIGIDQYILLVEMNVVTDDDAPLQEIYQSKAAATIDYVLQNGLEKAKLIPRPTATPLSPNQSQYYDDFAIKLITEAEASEIYMATWMGEAEGSIDGTWEALGDNVASNRKQVCRFFEDRTNVDVRWVSFNNCIFATKDFPFGNIAEYYKQPGDIELKSTHTYDGDFVLYGYQSGRTNFDAYLLDGEYIYFVSLESRTMGGETIENVFNQTIDDFIYNVLMTNKGQGV